MRRGLRAVVCLTTVSSRKDAERIARHLVKKRLAACVNLITGVASFYYWKGRLCREREVLLMIKASASRLSSLEKELKKIHSYALPEFVVLPIVKGSKAYLNWIASC